MSAHVLITGGAGFIGGALAEAFAERGDRVHLVDSFARGRRDDFLETLLARPGVELFERDLRRAGALDDLPTAYSHVFHLAAILGVAKVLEQPGAVLRENAASTAAVLAFGARQPRLERLVFASTSEVYAGSLEHMAMPVPTPEGTALALPDLAHPRSSYMLSKLYGEAMVQHSELPFTILRPHNVYGPRMGLLHVVPQLLEKAHRGRDGEPFEVFSVEHRRTFCFIDDAVALAMAASLAPSAAGRTLNLGTEAPEITIGALARIVLSTVGRDMPVDARPPTPGSPARRAPDMTRMRECTGLSSTTTVEEGVARTYRWYAEHVFDRPDPGTAR